MPPSPSKWLSRFMIKAIRTPPFRHIYELSNDMINAIRQLTGIGRGWYQYGLDGRRYWYWEFLLLGIGNSLILIGILFMWRLEGGWELVIQCKNGGTSIPSLDKIHEILI